MVLTECVRIAYADDHDILRKGVSELLASFGTCKVVVEANNGKELLTKLETNAADIDLCLLDIFMPELNGFETLTAIKLRWPDMPVLVLTGHNTDYFLVKMIQRGANGYLLKNSSPRELERAILSIHQNGIYHSDVMTARFFRSVMKKETQLPDFNEKEMQLLQYCCSDMSYIQIAEKMGISAKSVDWHRESLFKKLKVGSRNSLVMFAIQAGLVAFDIDTTAHTIDEHTHKNQ